MQEHGLRLSIHFVQTLFQIRMKYKSESYKMEIA